jgi:hypothetical protein
MNHTEIVEKLLSPIVLDEYNDKSVDYRIQLAHVHALLAIHDRLVDIKDELSGITSGISVLG